ncbi:hypothetical protein TNIN_209881 [Trichonephila inaurata madagascariensis]|uniref:Uncharacterized protein n=1 Tax=Trichonephila inaurata madagascariensis TaxID=2747483 RepID=A0A8X6XCS0_9ARAC|nr:hypothetical protein TNIN_209881 [Trichonephila inaurata madagascariensis]
MVGIQMENPDSVPLPAVTVCNKNRQVSISLQLEILILEKKFGAKRYAHMCQVFANGLLTETYSVLSTPNTAFPGKQMNRQCWRNILTVPVVNNNGYPNNCVAIETLWGQPDGQQQKLPVPGP